MVEIAKAKMLPKKFVVTPTMSSPRMIIWLCSLTDAYNTEPHATNYVSTAVCISLMHGRDPVLSTFDPSQDHIKLIRCIIPVRELLSVKNIYLYNV